MTKKSLVLIAILSLIFMIGCNFVNGIASHALTPGQALPSKVVVSTDGHSQLTLSSDWEVINTLNKEAELQVGNRKQQIYAIVITENKDDFESFGKYADLCYSKFVGTIDKPDVTGPTQITINGKPAIQYKISGAVKSLNVVYLYTLIEGNKYFDQLILWTLHSKFDTNENAMQHVIESFQEISK